ncbi:MAG: hypothetical protein J5502_06920 [Prevotella sp.]|nr:hypothetical protein [Prevotella sp.]
MLKAEYPYASMEKDQLISMIHFLVKREDEPTNETRAEQSSLGLCLVRRRWRIAQWAQENQELKDMVKELRDTHKQDVKTQASLLKTQSNLMKSIDNLTSQVADLTTQNKALQQKVNDLLSQISGNSEESATDSEGEASCQGCSSKL